MTAATRPYVPTPTPLTDAYILRHGLSADEEEFKTPPPDKCPVCGRKYD